jgi:exosome complex component CSL4
MSRRTQVLPGDVLGPADKYAPGPGTYIRDNQILSSVRGVPRTTTQTSPASAASANTTSTKPRTTPVLSVRGPTGSSRPLLPAVGTIVYARITAVSRLQAICSIVALEHDPATLTDKDDDDRVEAAAHPFRGILRAQDVRATEKDRVNMGAAVRVGDVVRAAVVSVGDQGGYFLSTAGNEFGVVMAWSDAGNLCVPVSWCEVLDEATGTTEERKVAKPV